MIFLSLVGCFLIFWFNKPKLNVLLDPLTLFFVGLLYYGFFVPTTMVLFGENQLPFLNSNLYVTDRDMMMISIVLFLGFGGFVLGYRVFIPRNYVDQTYKRALQYRYRWNDEGLYILIFMLVASLSACVIFFRQELVSLLSGYEGKISTLYEASTFYLIYDLSLSVATVLMVRTVLFAKNYLPYAIGAVTFLFAWAIVTFSKGPMIFGALVLFSAGARFAASRQILTFFGALIVGVGVLLLFLPAFAVYRYTGRLSFVNPDDLSLPLLFSDARGPFSVFVLAVRGTGSVELGPLWESFLLWIPRGVWMDRPLDAAEEFARAVMPGWRPGHGLGFSPFAEARIRFGVALSPLLLFLSGLSVSGLQRLAIRMVPHTLATSLLLVIQGYLLFTFHRGTFSGIFTTMVQFWIPFLTIGGLFGLILRLGIRRWVMPRTNASSASPPSRGRADPSAGFSPSSGPAPSSSRQPSSRAG